MLQALYPLPAQALLKRTNWNQMGQCIAMAERESEAHPFQVCNCCLNITIKGCFYNNNNKTEHMIGRASRTEGHFHERVAERRFFIFWHRLVVSY